MTRFGMHCQRCQKPLRSSDGVKCDDCESRFHVKCITSSKDMESGDRRYQWKCAVCHHPVGKSGSYSHVLLKTINQISEKIELVNKIQIPKLNSDLLMLKSSADRIAKQNEEILDKIDQLRKAGETTTVVESRQTKPSRSHRRTPLNLTAITRTDTDEAPIVPADKYVIYKTRRRSYHLTKVFLLVNRKLLKARTRNKSPR